jgi:hypothetical protein
MAQLIVCVHFVEPILILCSQSVDQMEWLMQIFVTYKEAVVKIRSSSKLSAEDDVC